MPTVLLKLERVAHHRLGGPLAPYERRHRRHRHHIVQLDALHLGLELASDKPPRGRLASAAGTADKQQRDKQLNVIHRDRHGDAPRWTARSAAGPGLRHSTV